MSLSRLEALRGMLAQDPTNSFARYSLAMELAGGGALDDAVQEFENLLAANPDYAAGYFHAGQTYEKLGLLDRARDTYTKGIEVTGRLGDAHTRSELQGALDLLPI
jgi:predicted Zn-dependent protease